MNKFFEKWIIEAVSELEGEFTVANVLDTIIRRRGTSMYIGNTQAIDSLLCKREDRVIRLGDGYYRRNEE